MLVVEDKVVPSLLGFMAKGQLAVEKEGPLCNLMCRVSEGGAMDVKDCCVVVVCCCSVVVVCCCHVLMCYHNDIGCSAFGCYVTASDVTPGFVDN